MFRRIASLCCILPLLGVASGLALDWHRSTPATADRSGAVPICCSHSHDEAPAEAPASGDHENCPVCYVLATAAQPVLPPPVTVVSRLTYPVEVTAVLDQVACSVVPALPSQPRAPPAV
ncbi:MAG: hypothetical protein HRU75_10425 [Planctomycetia bacterium]|nr:MAG: hypothetical protein HRU75_10425 [Planctomycetia bacterium]